MTSPAGSTPRRHGHAGVLEPQPSPNNGKAAAPFHSQLRRPRGTHDSRNERLSDAARRALKILDNEGSLRACGRNWVSPKGEKVGGSTLESLFDRFLVKVIAENGHRVTVTSRLTEIGERVARDLGRETYLMTE